MRAAENVHRPVDAALALAGLQWQVFPLHTPREGACSCRDDGCKSIGKHPRTINGLKDATTSTETIARWWGMWPDANIGLRTGRESGIVAIDVDPRHGGDDALHRLEREHGELPATVTSMTGSGGLHLIYRHPGEPVKNSAGDIAPGVDVRGEGGYIVAPPSSHASGRPYTWSVDGTPDEVELAELPDWLAQRLKQQQSNGRARPLEEWRTLAARGAANGERNVRTAQLAGHLLARGVDPFVALELLLAWDAQRNRPPLGGDVVVRTVRSIARAEAAKWTS